MSELSLWKKELLLPVLVQLLLHCHPERMSLEWSFLSQVSLMGLTDKVSVFVYLGEFITFKLHSFVPLYPYSYCCIPYFACTAEPVSSRWCGQCKNVRTPVLYEVKGLKRSPFLGQLLVIPRKEKGYRVLFSKVFPWLLWICDLGTSSVKDGASVIVINNFNDVTSINCLNTCWIYLHIQ